MKAFSDGVTYEATKILEQNIQGGTGTHANIGCPAGGKTGTTDKNIDAWFVGFTPRLSTAVWVGFPGSAAISMNGMYAPTGGNIDGGTYPADIWGEYMKQAVGKYCGDFKKPTEPFQSQPFLGHYAREGGKDDERTRTARTIRTRPASPRARRPPPATTPRAATGRSTTGARQRRRDFDPNAYETPPQHRRAETPGGGTQAPPTTASPTAPDWYNLRRQGRRRAAWWYAGGSAGSTPRACWIQRSAVRWLPVS